MESFIFTGEFCSLNIITENNAVISIEKADSDFKDKKPQNAFQNQIYTQLCEYFEGKRKNFKLKINPKGTDFQKRVWQILLTIPYCETVSYKNIAIKLDSPKSCRAVANAIGKNPILIIIPCHRVIASNGTLGGFSAGLNLKVKLLSLEKAF